MTAVPPAPMLPAATPQPDRRRRLPLSWFLAAVIGLAMMVAMALLLWLTLGTARENTLQLLRDKAQLVLTLVRARTDQFLEPAEALAGDVARRIERGEINTTDQTELVGALGYALSAAPQINAAVYVDAEGWLVSVFRDRETGRIGSSFEDWQGDAAVKAAIAQLHLDSEPQPHWGEPLFSAGAAATLVYFAHPVLERDGDLGIVVATTTVQDLSAFIGSIDTPGTIGTFILYGKDRVMAHPRLRQGSGLTTADKPLPGLAEIGDPALAAIWAPGWEERRIAELDIDAHWSTSISGNYVYLYDELTTARETPWVIGGYFRAEDIGQEWRRVNIATGIAGGLLVLSLAGAVLLARLLARPATQIADAARSISALELERIEPLGGSRIREIDDAERSLNAVVGALRSFVRYLPSDLVHYVLRHPERDIGKPRLRSMSILFTDISGFTALAENLEPAAVGALLNAHFADLEACIRGTGGTIDKYLGDGLLAFWGAPEPLADHQRRAVEAALAMAEVTSRHNAEAAVPLRLRIGIAAGEILVGDLGAPTRMNYTVVGDPVNLAQRLLEIGHSAAPTHETVIVTTAECIAAIEPPPRTRPLGEHAIRGRVGTVELVEVLPPIAEP
ncbi:MAG: adenylate/guanylate cyclase domain-containing protein [Geminicoccaceae bacterium]